MMIHPTPQEIKDYRAKHGYGLDESRRILTQERMKEALESATTLDDLKPILKKLIEGWRG